MSALAELLDREFRLWIDRKGTGDIPATQKELADLLGISASHLSRLRSGQAALTSDAAHAFAKALRQGDNQEIGRLRDELLVAAKEGGEPRSSSSHSISRWSLDNVKDLFERLGRRGAFLAVEYRDCPRAFSEGKYGSYAVDAGRAIARGLSFALHQPFGIVEFESNETQDHHTIAVRLHLFELRDMVRDVYRRMRQAAIRAARDEMQMKPDEIKEIDNRIVLYEANCEPFIRSGIQTRTFYAEVPLAHDDDKSYEVWEWVAAQDEDLFVQRDLEQTPHRVMKAQFFPIPHFWEKHGRLPVTAEDMDKAHELQEDYLVDAQVSSNPWWTSYREEGDGESQSTTTDQEIRKKRRPSEGRASQKKADRRKRKK